MQADEDVTALRLDSESRAEVTIETRTEPTTALHEHACISIAFEVRTVLDVELENGGLGGFRLIERFVTEPWLKDYDDGEDGPTRWAKRFDISNWGLVSAWNGATRIGGAVIAFDTPGLNMLEGGRDLAVVWDIRIAPQWRRKGVGSMLFRAAEDWARARGCCRVDVETQNINVGACRLYTRMGCELRRLDRLAYADLPEEAQLIWSKRIA